MQLQEIIILLKATRVHRTLTGLSAVMVPVAFANFINTPLLLFCASSILLYSGAGILNAQKDNDYPLPRSASWIAAAIFIVCFSIAAFNTMVFLGIIGEFIMGMFYNYFSRYLFLGDVTTLTLTHHAWPTFIGSRLLGIDSGLSLKLSVYMFLVFWSIIHIKNLKDDETDRARGYKTLTTVMAGRGRILTVCAFELSYIFMAAAMFIFHFSVRYLLVLSILAFLNIYILLQTYIGREEKALDYMRMMVIIFLFGFVWEKAESTVIYLSFAAIFCLYCLFLFRDMEIELARPLKVMKQHVLSWGWMQK